MAVSTATATELTREQVANLLVKPLEEASKFLASRPRIFDTNGAPRIPKLGGPTTDLGRRERADPRDGPDVRRGDAAADHHEVGQDDDPVQQRAGASVRHHPRRSAAGSAGHRRGRQARRAVLSAGRRRHHHPEGPVRLRRLQRPLAVGGAITLDALLDAEGLALAANVNPAGLRWVITSRELVKLRKVKATDGQYIVTPDVTAGRGYLLFGHPVVVSNRVPDTTGGTPTARAALVDFAQVAVARDLAPTVKILDQTFGDYDQMAIRVVARYDAKPLNAPAVVKLTGITI